MLPLIFPGFLSSSIIGRAPWPPSLDGPGPWISRVRTILARISQDLSYPPGASHRHASRPSLPFSTRIPTGVRTDSGEERQFLDAFAVLAKCERKWDTVSRVAADRV